LSKRFTDTEKWRHAWFRKLTPVERNAWFYLLDNCDHAGIWPIDMELMSFTMNANMTLKELCAAFSGRIVLLPGDKLFIKGFIRFQYGELNSHVKAHQGVIKVLKYHQLDIETLEYVGNSLLTVTKEFDNSTSTVQDQDKDQDKDKDQERKLLQVSQKPEHFVLDEMNKVTSRDFKAVDANLKFIRARLAEGFEPNELISVVRTKFAQWGKDPKMRQYVRPATLFNAEKFQGYREEAKAAIDRESKLDALFGTSLAPAGPEIVECDE
jgi:uncharacterized phage protein (TIGR02220 family)